MHQLRIPTLYRQFVWTYSDSTRSISKRFKKPTTTGGISVTKDYADRRKHQRIEVVQAIFIEIVHRGSKSEAENTVIRCETVDISVSGLRIYVPQAIVQGSQLNIAVPMDNWKENLELTGEAMWIKPVEEGEGFWVGLELHDSNRQSMEKWFKVVHSLSSIVPG